MTSKAVKRAIEAFDKACRKLGAAPWKAAGIAEHADLRHRYVEAKHRLTQSIAADKRRAVRAATAIEVDGTICPNTGLLCLPGCNQKECAGLHTPLKDWPEPR